MKYLLVFLALLISLWFLRFCIGKSIIKVKNQYNEAFAF